MEVKILKEAGYNEALLGLSLSYNTDLDKMPKVARRLCGKDGGENKFLESIVVWLDVNAPRSFWQQVDTYRVGMTKQSESTMHTILRNELTYKNFEGHINPTILEILNVGIRNKDFDFVKRHLPESFLQRRIMSTNYKCLRNIILQRSSHRLAEWRFFIKSLSDLEYAHLLPLPEMDE